jgi:hypothetical protein
MGARQAAIGAREEFSGLTAEASCGARDSGELICAACSRSMRGHKNLHSVDKRKNIKYSRYLRQNISVENLEDENFGLNFNFIN